MEALHATPLLFYVTAKLKKLNGEYSMGINGLTCGSDIFSSLNEISHNVICPAYCRSFRKSAGTDKVFISSRI